MLLAHVHTISIFIDRVCGRRPTHALATRNRCVHVDSYARMTAITDTINAKAARGQGGVLLEHAYAGGLHRLSGVSCHVFVLCVWSMTTRDRAGGISLSN